MIYDFSSTPSDSKKALASGPTTSSPLLNLLSAIMKQRANLQWSITNFVLAIDNAFFIDSFETNRGHLRHFSIFLDKSDCFANDVCVVHLYTFIKNVDF
jgi:hypothetical protein